MGWVEVPSRVLTTEEAELVMSATSLSMGIRKISSSIVSPVVEEGSSKEVEAKASTIGCSQEIWSSVSLLELEIFPEKIKTAVRC